MTVHFEFLTVLPSVTSTQARQAPQGLFPSLSNVTNLVQPISTPTRHIGQKENCKPRWKTRNLGDPLVKPE